MSRHFELLGLPAHADAIAVRRAYARALRGIDPAVEPAAFARLREAYEAARAWCEQQASPDAAPAWQSPDAPGSGPGSDPDPGPDPDPKAEAEAEETSAAGAGSPGASVPVSAPTSASPIATAAEDTVRLAWQFAADVSARGPAAIPSLLDDALAALRMQYIDGPGQFEEHVIDLIGLQRIAWRADVFAAAEARFHWDEVGHLAGLDGRGRWVELVLAQRQGWLGLDAGRQAGWHALLLRAEQGLDEKTTRRWPDIAPLCGRFPEWLGLYVSSGTIDAWKSAFAALPAATRDEYTRRAPEAQAYMAVHLVQAHATRRQRSAHQAIAVFVLALMVGVVNLISSGARHSAPAAVTPWTMGPETATQCAELYRALDTPGALEQAPATVAATLKERAHRCALAGRWHAPAPIAPITQPPG